MGRDEEKEKCEKISVYKKYIKKSCINYILIISNRAYAETLVFGLFGANKFV